MTFVLFAIVGFVLVVLGFGLGVFLVSADPRPIVVIHDDQVGGIGPLYVIGPRGLRQADLNTMAAGWWRSFDPVDGDDPVIALSEHLLRWKGFKLPGPLEILGIDAGDPNLVVPLLQLGGTTGRKTVDAAPNTGLTEWDNDRLRDEDDLP